MQCPTFTNVYWDAQAPPHHEPGDSLGKIWGGGCLAPQALMSAAYGLE